MLRTMVLATLLGSFLLAQGARIRQQSNNQIRISYSLPKTNLGLHEPVLLTFLVSNDSAKAAVLDLGQDRKGGYIIAVAAPGRPSIELPQYSREGISRIGTISLKPGESFSQQLILNQWYDFPTPGEYKLEARLIQPVIISNDSEVADSGFRGTIEVGPRDELQLAKTCDSLAARIDESQGYEDAAEAALILSYVDDPIAVPYLKRVLYARKLVEPIAINGLERIGDEEAVRTLISALSSGEPGETAMLARASLERIEQETTNLALKETITQALSTARRKVS